MGSAATMYRLFLLHSAANDDGPPPQSNMRADGGTSDNAKNASCSAALRPHGGTPLPKSKSFDMNSTGQEARRGGELSAYPIAVHHSFTWVIQLADFYYAYPMFL